MNKKHILLILGLLSISGSTLAQTPSQIKTLTQATASHPSITPEYIIIYQNHKIKQPYTVLTTLNIPNINPAGTKRSPAVMTDLLRKQASMLGGNAIIDLIKNPDSLSATIVYIDGISAPLLPVYSC